jgi:hypothetical protein
MWAYLMRLRWRLCLCYSFRILSLTTWLRNVSMRDLHREAFINRLRSAYRYCRVMSRWLYYDDVYAYTSVDSQWSIELLLSFRYENVFFFEWDLSFGCLSIDFRLCVVWLLYMRFNLDGCSWLWFFIWCKIIRWRSNTIGSLHIKFIRRDN